MHSKKKKKMSGCFNPILGKTWTNPAIGLHFIYIFNPMCLVCPIGLKQPSIFLD